MMGGEKPGSAPETGVVEAATTGKESFLRNLLDGKPSPEAVKRKAERAAARKAKEKAEEAAEEASEQATLAEAETASPDQPTPPEAPAPSTEAPAADAEGPAPSPDKPAAPEAAKPPEISTETAAGVDVPIATTTGTTPVVEAQTGTVKESTAEGFFKDIMRKIEEWLKSVFISIGIWKKEEEAPAPTKTTTPPATSEETPPASAEATSPETPAPEAAPTETPPIEEKPAEASPESETDKAFSEAAKQYGLDEGTLRAWNQYGNPEPLGEKDWQKFQNSLPEGSLLKGKEASDPVARIYGMAWSIKEVAEHFSLDIKTDEGQKALYQAMIMGKEAYRRVSKEKPLKDEQIPDLYDDESSYVRAVNLQVNVLVARSKEWVQEAQ